MEKLAETQQSMLQSALFEQINFSESSHLNVDLKDEQNITQKESTPLI